MTEMIADAILDWIDTDDEQREVGAERDYYSSQDPPYLPRNGPLGSIEELLMVRGVTPALLFGADLNRNGAIEGAEQVLTTIDNADNSTGQLNRGWAAYLTVDSAEANLRPDGKPKIDVNMDNLSELHKQLLEVLDKDQADFIVAFRQGGSYAGNESGQSVSNVRIDLTQRGNERLTTILDLIGVRTRIARQTQSMGGGNQLSLSFGRGQQQTSPNSGQLTIAGASPTRPTGDGGTGGSGEGQSGSGSDSRVVIEPAFPNDKSAMQAYLPKLMDNLAVNASKSIPGRLNINQAPRVLLLGVPGLTPDKVDQILSHRDVTLGQQHPEQKYETWLLSQDIVDLETMKKLMSLVTAGGSVYRAQVVGFYDAEGPAHRIEVVVDGTKSPPVIRRRWDLRDLGPGYTPEVLGVAAEDAR